MSTLVVGEQPFMSEWLAQRRVSGHDHRDEVWEGVYHVVPHASVRHARVAQEVLWCLRPRAEERGLVGLGEFNLGQPGDFRVPDAGWLRADAEPDLQALYASTAVAVLEVLSPGDETFAKLDFYAARGVQEVFVADPEGRTFTGYRCKAGPWAADPDSAVFGCSVAWIQDQVRWP